MDFKMDQIGFESHFTRLLATAQLLDHPLNPNKIFFDKNQIASYHIWNSFSEIEQRWKNLNIWFLKWFSVLNNNKYWSYHIPKAPFVWKTCWHFEI